MPHSAMSVANKLIALAHEAGRAITPMQVIKLTYFCHAWMLGLHSRPLLDEPVEAWQYGPVISEVYRNLRRYGGGPVTRPIPNVKDADFDPIELDLIEQVSVKYGRLTGPRLSAMTHAPGTPWHQVWNGRSRKTRIPNHIIEQFYAAQARKVAEETSDGR